MGERNPGSLLIVTRHPLFCLLMITSTIFALSWFYVLRSAGHSPLIDHTLLPNSMVVPGRDYDNPEFHSRDEGESVNQLTFANNEKQDVQKLTDMSTNVDVKCHSSDKDVLQVFMYDLPPEFHFKLIEWEPQAGNTIWPDLRRELPHYPGALNLQHSLEYWMTLDLLASELPSHLDSPSAVRVRNSSEADIIFVPFFASLSSNRYSKISPPEKKSKNTLLQEKLITYLKTQEEWKRSGGRDHVIVAHHPNSLLDARMKLYPSMFILSDFGRYPPYIANLEKDLIAPYKHVVGTYANDFSNFDSRPTLLYFQGAIHRKDGGHIRQELYHQLKDEKDVHFAFGSARKGGIRNVTEGMRSSKFCLHIAGDTPSSNHLFDAIASHCVPVIISDDIELPYEDVLDYSEFCIFVRSSDALEEHFLMNLIRSIEKNEWTQMWERLKEVEIFYEFQHPSKENDAVQMIWQAIARRVPFIKRKIHNSWRFSRLQDKKDKGLVSISLPRNLW